MSTVTTKQAVLNVPSAAALLGMSEKALRRQVERGRVPFRHLGRKLIFIECELTAWLDTLPGVTLEEVKEMQARRG